jgi:hypothetical protein
VRRFCCLALVLLLVGGAPLCAQEPPDPADLVNTLLDGLLGFRTLTGPELEAEVAEVGGVPFRAPVPLDFMSRSELARYLQGVFDDEYPVEKAGADQRALSALGLLPSGLDLRRLRAHLLEQNIAGFYDERPGKKRLYAVSDDKRLTPLNQIVLAHELRHALQDQYAEVHRVLPASVGDYDDRRLAYLSLLEGDATLVMERFLLRLLPVGEESGSDAGASLAGLSLPGIEMPGAPPVVRDQLVMPYLVGRDFAQAVQKGGGWSRLREAWTRPPESTEQVLHPERYFEGEPPRPVALTFLPRGGRLLGEGVLGELLLRTWLGEGQDVAAEGWGGDRFQVWDVQGRTVLVWRLVWDSPRDADEFERAALARLRGWGQPLAARGEYKSFEAKPWRVAFGRRAGGFDYVSSDDSAWVELAVKALGQP